MPDSHLETILKNGLMGLNLNYPLRTRSKVLKTKVCEILGYPVPKTFRKSKPRFPGQNFDTYIQKGNNLQIWNEEVTPTRRYVIIRLDQSSVVTGLRVVTGDRLAKLNRTGTLTKKYQAKSRQPVTASVLVSKTDSYAVIGAIKSSRGKQVHLKQCPSVSKQIDFGQLCSIECLFRKLKTLTGKFLSDPGLDQERNRGAALHRAVCKTMGLSESCDTGACPDVIEQLLEIKLQTAPTIDLGLISPDDTTPLVPVPGMKHCDVRYAVFYGKVVGKQVRLDHVVLCTGADFFTFFKRFEGKITNSKLQIPLPRDFFD